MSFPVVLLIPSALRQSASASSVPGQAGPPVPTELLAALGSVVDPRHRRGVRHSLLAVLGIAVCAVLGGARSFTAISEWATDLPRGVRLTLGIWRRPPCESTIRRVLQRVDSDALDRCVCDWLADTSTSGQTRAAGRRHIALDGKTARGARRPDGRAQHLFAAIDTDTGITLGQCPVDGKTNEISVFGPLLDRIDITGALISADALHPQHRHAEYLRGRGAHYLFTVKANQPSLHTQLAALPWARIPVVDDTCEKGHGRIESRRLQLCEINTGIGFPDAQLAARITRRRTTGRRQTTQTETVFAVTDLSYHNIRADQLADALRAHWAIENRLHRVRDVTYDEDRSQIRTGHGPAVMATLRNLAISIHRQHSHPNIAAASRHISRHPTRALQLATSRPG